MKIFGRSFASTEEGGCINGDGINSPNGLLLDGTGAEIGVTVSGTGALTYDNIVELYFSLGREFRREASWLMSDTTAFALRTITDSVGNPIWRHSDDSLFGRPVFVSPHMPDVAPGAKPVLFGDFSYYWLIERNGTFVRTFNESFALMGQTGFQGVKLVDGHLVKREAVKVLQMTQ